METPTKSSGNNDRGLVKKSKGFDALEMSIGNGNAENADGGADQSISKRFVNHFVLFLSACNPLFVCINPIITHTSKFNVG